MVAAQAMPRPGHGLGWPAEVKAAVLSAYRPGEVGYARVGAKYGVPSGTVAKWIIAEKKAGRPVGLERGPAPVGVLVEPAGELVKVGESSDPLPIADLPAPDPADWGRLNVSHGRIRRLIDGWVRLQEDSQATAAALLARIREVGASSDDLKALASAVAAATQTGERGHNAWLDIVRPDRKATTVDARSLTVQQVWANVERRRDRGATALLTEIGSALDGGAGDAIDGESVEPGG